MNEGKKFERLVKDCTCPKCRKEIRAAFVQGIGSARKITCPTEGCGADLSNLVEEVRLKNSK